MLRRSARIPHEPPYVCSIGSVKEKQVPSRRPLATQMRPPRRSTIRLQMCSPRPKPWGLPSRGSLAWRNLSKIACCSAGGDAGAVVAHVDAQEASGLRQRDLHPALARVAELHRVGEQVEHHLHDAVEVRGHHRHALRHLRAQLDALFLEQLAHRRDRVLDDFLHVHRTGMPLDVARLELGDVEDLVDQPRQALAFLDDDAELARALGRLEVRVVAQDLREGADRGERRAQFVRHGRDEIVLQPVEFLQALVGGRAAPRWRAPARCDFCSSRWL